MTETTFQQICDETKVKSCRNSVTWDRKLFNLAGKLDAAEQAITVSKHWTSGDYPDCQ